MIRARASLGLVFVAMLGLAACSGAASGDPEPSPPAATQSAPAPADTETSADVELTSKPLEQTVTIEEMDAMSVDEYAKLPFADRLAYGAFKVGVEAYPLLDAGNVDDITGTEGFEQPGSAIPSYFWQYASSVAFNSPDPDERAKLAGSYAWYTTDKQTGSLSAEYQDAIDAVVARGGEGITGDSEWAFVDAGEFQHGIDRDGSPIDFMNITYNNSGDGTSGAGLRTGQAIYTEVTFLDGETAVFWALGYTIEGQASPVSDYAY